MLCTDVDRFRVVILISRYIRPPLVHVKYFTTSASAQLNYRIGDTMKIGRSKGWIRFRSLCTEVIWGQVSCLTLTKKEVLVKLPPRYYKQPLLNSDCTQLRRMIKRSRHNNLLCPSFALEMKYYRIRMKSILPPYLAQIFSLFWQATTGFRSLAK